MPYIKSLCNFKMDKELCRTCGKLVPKKNLARHLKSHSGDKKFSCFQWCKLYPVYFPNRNMTRKMVEWSIVMPRYSREKKVFMKTVLRLEQEGEHLHQVLNSLETRFKSVYNKQERYFLILRELENKHYAWISQLKICNKYIFTALILFSRHII